MERSVIITDYFYAFIYVEKNKRSKQMTPDIQQMAVSVKSWSGGILQLKIDVDSINHD